MLEIDPQMLKDTGFYPIPECIGSSFKRCFLKVADIHRLPFRIYHPVFPYTGIVIEI